MRTVARNVRRGGKGRVMMTSLDGVKSAVYGFFIVYRKGSPSRVGTVARSITRFAHGGTRTGPATISKLEGTR